MEIQIDIGAAQNILMAIYRSSSTWDSVAIMLITWKTGGKKLSMRRFNIDTLFRLISIKHKSLVERGNNLVVERFLPLPERPLLPSKR